MSLQKSEIVFLLPVWGETYIKQFFAYGLRTLLAPGNIPTLSIEYKCTFLFLTREENISYFKKQPGYIHLLLHCEVQFIDISDLFLEGSYSLTLTLPYDRGMKSRGDKICSTFFCI